MQFDQPIPFEWNSTSEQTAASPRSSDPRPDVTLKTYVTTQVPLATNLSINRKVLKDRALVYFTYPRVQRTHFRSCCSRFSNGGENSNNSVYSGAGSDDNGNDGSAGMSILGGDGGSVGSNGSALGGGADADGAGDGVRVTVG